MKASPGIGVSTAMAVALLCATGCRPAAEVARGAGSAETDAESRSVSADTSVSAAYVAERVRQEFAGMAVIDSVHLRPYFHVGDFDGDGRSDLAVMGRLASDTASVTGARSLVQAYVPMGTGMKLEAGDLRMPAERLTRWRGEAVQLVIHDFRGTVTAPPLNALLLFAVRDESVLRVARVPLKPAIAGDEPEVIAPPVLRGDAILLLHDDGEGAALYWDGERYRWYPYGDSAQRTAR